MSKLQKSDKLSRLLKAARKFVKRPLRIVDKGLIEADKAVMGWVLLSNNLMLRFRQHPNGDFIDERTIGDRRAW